MRLQSSKGGEKGETAINLRDAGTRTVVGFIPAHLTKQSALLFPCDPL